MENAARSVRSDKSSRKSGSSRHANKVKKGSGPKASLEKKGPSLQFAKKGSPPKASESTQVVSSGSASAFEALRNVRQALQPQNQTPQTPNKQTNTCTILCGVCVLPNARSRESREGFDPLGL